MHSAEFTVCITILEYSYSTSTRAQQDSAYISVAFPPDAAQGADEVPQMTPLSPTPKNSSSRLTPSSTIYDILNLRKVKMSQSFSRNTNSFNTAISVSNNFTVTNDRSNILAWISPLDPKLRHQDIQDRRIESIGEWLLQTEEFRSWHAASGGDGSDNTVLFCYGDPGVGKTYIR